MAALWGSIVGAEREYRNKSAGFKSMILISVGACFFTYMSLQIGSPNNADRIASNIITGIGFIGAGVIFRSKTHISGITTATTIWVVAAIGMGIGAGYYFESACAGLLILFVLAILPSLEKIIDGMNQNKTYTVKYIEVNYPTFKIETMAVEIGLRYTNTERKKKGDCITMVYMIHGNAKKHKLLIDKIMVDKTIKSFSVF